MLQLQNRNLNFSGIPKTEWYTDDCLGFTLVPFFETETGSVNLHNYVVEDGQVETNGAVSGRAGLSCQTVDTQCHSLTALLNAQAKTRSPTL